MINRRTFLTSAAAGGVVLASGAAQAAESAKKGEPKPRKGRVYNAGNGWPLAGITVSDGLVCVQSAKDGTFELPYRAEARFVTVTVPSGYESTRFYAPLRQDGARFDFGLRESKLTAGKGCSFIQIADSEANAPGSGVQSMAENARAFADEVKAAFIVHTGDICGEGGMRGHLMSLNSVAMRRPVHYVVGNHDLVGADFGERLFEDLFGPCWYSFEAGGIHFCTTPMNYGDRPPKYTMDEAADWLRNDLALVPKTMPVILLGHMICGYGSGKTAGVVFGDKRKVDLRTLCNYRGFIYGHLHDTIVRRINGVTVACSTQPHLGGIDMSPGMIRAVIVDADGNITMKNRYAGEANWKPAATPCVWEQKLGAPVLYSTPLVKDGTVYLATLDDEGRGTAAVFALDAKTGKVLWKTPTANSIKNRVLCACGNVCALDAAGRIVALDAKTGREKWNCELPYHYQVVTDAPALAPDGKTVVFGVVRQMAAVDAETGAVKWMTHDHPTDGIPHRFAIDAERIYATSSWDGIYATDLKTGKIVWKIKDFGGCVYPGCDPLLLDGKLYVALRRTIREIDPATGKVLRTKTLKNPYEFGVASGPMYVTDKLFVIGSSCRGVVALDRETFEPVWNTTNGKSLLATTAYTGLTGNIGNVSPIRLPDGTLCAPAADGAVHFFSEKDGKEAKKIVSGVPYAAGAALTDEKTIVVADMAGAVRAYAV